MTQNFQEKITIIVPTHIRSISLLYPICRSILADLPFDEKQRYLLMVALSEAYSNAFEHGNQENPDTEIKLTFYLAEKYLKIVIEDEAILPIKDNVIKLRKTGHPEDIGGRGLGLITRIFDESSFEYTEDGNNRVTLKAIYKIEFDNVYKIQEI